MSPSATTNGAPRSYTLVPSAERASKLAGALAVGDDTADADRIPRRLGRAAWRACCSPGSGGGAPRALERGLGG